jgi:precorrin-2 dehydrogenase/sirohydrochlorin ferrochelatase
MIEATLPLETASAIESVGRLRAALRKRAPGPAEGKRRMEWMVRVCDQWSLEELATMDEAAVEAVLDGWEDDVAKGPGEILGARQGVVGRLLSAPQRYWRAASADRRALLSGVGGFGVGVGMAFVILTRTRR